MEQDKSLRFYDMQAHINVNGIIVEENIAIKQVWEKRKNTILDVYLYKSKQSRIIDSAYIKNLYDNSTGKMYYSIKTFVEDFNAEEISVPVEDKITNQKQNIIFKQLEHLHDEIVILHFLSSCSNDANAIKSKIIGDYIKKYLSTGSILSSQYIDSYLKKADIKEDDFYASLDNLKNKNPEHVIDLLKEVIKISFSDGKISIMEKFYIAEIIQTLREYNIEIDF